ncbi:MAG: hypothetical protein AABZ94_02140 [Candidatus Eisenbacteria bacterium]
MIQRRRDAAGAILAAAVALLLNGPALPARAETRVLETPNFRVVYYAPTLSYLAPYAARCFENSLRFHRRLFSYTPWDKVNIVLGDPSDFGNAGVSVNPRNMLSMDVAPVNFVYETGPSNERVNFTMNHEAVHVVALDQAAGFDRVARRLLSGKIRESSDHPETMIYSYLTVPRRAAPRWFHEGAAVFFETWMAGGLGRAQGPYDEMVFRSRVRDGSRIYDPLGLESEGTKVDFQVGVNSYLYGTRFLSYLALEHGPERLVEWVGRAPGSKPYFASQFRKVYGRSLGQGWNEWIAWERGFQQANLDSLRRYPITPYRDLSPRALGSVSRAVLDPEQRTLYAGVQYPGAFGHIAAIPLDGGEPRHLRDVKGAALYFVTSIARDPASGTLFYTEDNSAWRDLCALDPATGRSRVLQRDLRVGDLAFNAADSSLWGVRHYNGISTLVRIPAPYRDWNRIASWPFGQDLYDLDISPDGTKLSASFAEPSGRQTLRIMEIAELMQRDSSATITILHNFGSSIPTGFVFSPDGRYLFGSSYYTGVSNIWRFDLESRAMEIVTNTETGFFRPVPLSNDSLVVFRYTGEGFVPATIGARPLQDVSAISFLGARIAGRHPLVREWKIPPPSAVALDSIRLSDTPYRAGRKLGLAGLYPIVEGYKDYAAVGLAALLSDPLQLERFTLSASVTPGEALPSDERWHLSLDYKRARWNAGVKWNGASFYDLIGPTKASRKGYGATLTRTTSIISDRPREMEWSLGVAGYGGLDRLPEYQNVATAPGFDKLLTSSVSLSYRNMRSSIGAIDTEKGIKWRLTGIQQLVRQGFQGSAVWQGYPLAYATLDLGTPLPIRNSSIWLRTATGTAAGSRDDPFANFFFGGFGNNGVDYREVKRYRGYDAFPGRALNEIGGHNFAKTTVDWSLPALRFRRVGVLPFYASYARLGIFGSGLVTNLDDTASRRKLANLGAQVDIRFQLLTQQPLTLSIGYARAFERGFRPTRESMISLKIL